MSILKAVLENITAKETRNDVLVAGVSYDYLFYSIKGTYNTSRFQNTLAVKTSAYSFKIPLFFLYDFYQVIKGLLAYQKSYYISKRKLQKLLEALNKLPRIQQLDRVFPSRLNSKKLKDFAYAPLPTQEEFFEIYDQNTRRFCLNGYILGAAPGAGKTLSSLMLAWQRNDIDAIVIFSPNNALREVWEDMVLNKMKTDVPFYVYGSGKPVNPQAKVFVFSHENTGFAVETIKKHLAHRKIFFYCG